MVSEMQVRAGDLVRAAVGGDEAAFTALVERHHRDLLRVAYVICRDRGLAEDATQAAWTSAWSTLTQVRDPDRVRSWLVAIVANEARRIMRSRRARIREIPASEVDRLMVAEDLGSDPSTHGIAIADLRRAVDALDPTDRALIALRFVGLLSSDEIGAALGLSPSGARGRLSRLLVRLRGELGND